MGDSTWTNSTFILAGKAGEDSRAGPSDSKSMSVRRSLTKMIAWGFPMEMADTSQVLELHSRVCSTTLIPSGWFAARVVGTFDF